MARITVEDCLKRENNRFALVLLAAKRTKQLLTGAKVLLKEQRSNKAVVTSLREIASGQVRFMTAEEKLAQEEARAKALAEARASVIPEAAHAAEAAPVESAPVIADDSTSEPPPPPTPLAEESPDSSTPADNNGTQS